MADLILKSAVLLFTSATEDMTAQVQEVSVTQTYETHDNSRMNGSGARSRITGLYSWEARGQMIQNYASTEAVPVEKIMSSKLGQKFAIELRPVNAARSSDNPGYTGNVWLSEYSPMRGRVGELAVTPFVLVGDGAFTRTVTSS